MLMYGRNYGDIVKQLSSNKSFECNRPNAPIKRHRVAEWIKHRTYLAGGILQIKDIHGTESKMMEKGILCKIQTCQEVLK